jgi:hypothetical protein
VTDKKQITRQEAAAIRWKQGVLRWKLEPHQRDMYDKIHAQQGGKFYLNCARRIGKSFTLCIIAVEYAIRYPGSQIKYAAPTQKAVKKIVRVHFKKIFKDCPAKLRPVYNRVDGEFVFPNGSIIVAAGCDNENYENLRGTESHLNIVDECGFIDDLKYIVDDVLAPMTMDTGGKTLLASTPPRSPGHEAFSIAQELDALGKYARITIDQAADSGGKRLTRAIVDAYIDEQRGGRSVEEFKASSTYRREYLAEFVVDQDWAVIPEWTVEREGALMKSVETPALYDGYVSTDMGHVDGWGTLFGYWDFRNARLVIQREILKFKSRTDLVATEIKKVEKELWEADAEKTKGLRQSYHGKGGGYPYLRVGDNDRLEIANLSSHGLPFIPTKKDNKELQVNQLREMVASGQLIVDPSCKELVFQLRTTCWNSTHSSFERTEKGHGDLLDALVYMVRNVQRNRNPYPDAVYNIHETMYAPRASNTSSTGKVIKGMFARKR